MAHDPLCPLLLCGICDIIQTKWLLIDWITSLIYFSSMDSTCCESARFESENFCNIEIMVSLEPLLDGLAPNHLLVYHYLLAQMSNLKYVTQSVLHCPGSIL